MNKLSINSFEDPKYDFEPSIQYISKEKEHREKIIKNSKKKELNYLIMINLKEKEI